MKPGCPRKSRKKKDQQDEKAMSTKETDSNKAQERHSSSVVEDFDVTSGTSKTAFSLSGAHKYSV